MQKNETGFTLIELSIVLVIIGLIIGGVLVGQDLVRAAEVRATISQVEKFNTATNTFRGKFGYLPGDLNAMTATQFGFAARGASAGEGDGNGVIEGWASCCGTRATYESAGETIMFWVDLSSAVAGNLIEGGFNTASSTTSPGADITGTNLNLWLPQAKIGRGNYFYVYGGAYNSGGWASLGVNYFGLSAVTNIASSSDSGKIFSTPNIPVAEAYAIDKKIDDGMPQSGTVMAWYLQIDQVWTDGTDASDIAGEPKPYSGALAGSSATCYDNGSNSAVPTTYSMGQRNGAGPNCALSFKFQ